MVLPGVAGILYALLLIAVIPDFPAGSEAYQNRSDKTIAGKSAKAVAKPSYCEVLNQNLLALSACYFCVAIIREFFASWGPGFISYTYAEVPEAPSAPMHSIFLIQQQVWSLGFSHIYLVHRLLLQMK